MGIIYRKTRIGQDEIETRALRLLPRMRALLIVVDGRRDEDDLQAMLGYAPQAALHELLAYGLIEAVGQRAPSALAAAGDAASSTQPSALDPATFAMLRKEAVRALNDALGPAAETTAIRMERASTETELRAALERAASTIAAVRGAAAAREFADRFMPKG